MGVGGVAVGAQSVSNEGRYKPSGQEKFIQIQREPTTVVRVQVEGSDPTQGSRARVFLGQKNLSKFPKGFDAKDQKEKIDLWGSRKPPLEVRGIPHLALEGGTLFLAGNSIAK